MGRFVEEKGVGLLMRALDRVTEPWRALFVGGGVLEESLRQWAARYGDRVRIVKDVVHDQVPAHLNVMDVLCAPSQATPRWREQFGRMVVEAFACGIPVISSDSGELPYVVLDAGVIVGERDEDGWVSAIGELIGDPAKRSELSSMGIARAHSAYCVAGGSARPSAVLLGVARRRPLVIASEPRRTCAEPLNSDRILEAN